jgi:hypothetical protein
MSIISYSFLYGEVLQIANLLRKIAGLLGKPAEELQEVKVFTLTVYSYCGICTLRYMGRSPLLPMLPVSTYLIPSPSAAEYPAPESSCPPRMTCPAFLHQVQILPRLL